MGPISFPPCSLQHSWKSSSCPDSWTSCARARLSSLDRRAGQGAGQGAGTCTGTAALQIGCGCPPLRAGPGSLTTGVQVLPAEAGIHRVEDRAAGVGRAPASPQLRPQPPALGGRVTRCSCASRPAREPVPRRNGGSPVLSRQRSTCQGQ